MGGGDFGHLHPGVTGSVVSLLNPSLTLQGMPDPSQGITQHTLCLGTLPSHMSTFIIQRHGLPSTVFLMIILRISEIVLQFSGLSILPLPVSLITGLHPRHAALFLHTLCSEHKVFSCIHRTTALAL